MLGQSEEIAPVDQRLYALRDVTGTVESIPLIAASIMSKKLAESLDGLVLDVKTGSGAFLPDPARARVLAETMVAAGEARGCRVVALLTAMDRPLGRQCGNALEVRETLEVLEGGGPADLRAVTLALAEEMLALGGVAATRPDARTRLDAAIASGAARERFAQLVAAQGGDARSLDDPSRLPVAPVQGVVTADRAGGVSRIEPRTLGHALVELGGGRRQVTDTIDPAVGFTLHVTLGDVVTTGMPLVTVHARDAAGLARGESAARAAVEVGGDLAMLPLLQLRIDRDGATAL
jgi:pyrimidine-nucleoside phosphorylase